MHLYRYDYLPVYFHNINNREILHLSKTQSNEVQIIFFMHGVL